MADREEARNKIQDTRIIEDESKEEKILISWEAPERSFKKRDKDFWITAVAILVLVSVIFIFIHEFFLVIALGSVLFMYYMMSTVPPSKIKSKITNKAVYFGELRYPWEMLTRFWFKTNLDSRMVEFETVLRFPRQVSIVIEEKDEGKIKQVAEKWLPMIESSPTMVDKLSKWAGNKLPLENRESK